MDTALRPMSTGELLDRTFGLYRRNFLLFLGIAAPAPLLVLLLIVFSSVAEAIPGGGLGTNDAVGIAIVVVMVLLVFAMAIGFAISVGATIRAVASLHLSQPAGIRRSYAELRGHLWRVIGVTVAVIALVGLGWVVCYAIAVLLGIAAAAIAGALGTVGVVLGIGIAVAAFVAGILLALTLLVRYSMAIQACVIEGCSVRQAIRRSVFLAKKSRNRILTIYVLFSVLSIAMWGCLAFLADLVSEPIHSTAVSGALQALAFVLALVLTMPLATIAMSLNYYDERVRKEGYDLQVLIAGLEAPKANAAGA